MHLAHHPIFVALSVLTAWLGAWTALDLFRRTQAHVGTWRRAWLAAAGVAMGLSIWSMHFIAMLGFDPGTDVRYEVRLTLGSLLLAIAATTLAFFTAQPNRLRQLSSGLVMGAGICGMHYVGMAAVITAATLNNEPAFVVLAFVVAVSASSGALIVAMRETTLAQRVLAAVVLGFAIVGMHYTAMFGVRISMNAHAPAEDFGIEPLVLAGSVAAGTLFILLLALIAALADRRFQALEVREALRSQQQLRAIFDNLPFGIYVAAAPTGQVRFANAEALRLLGRPLVGTPVWAHEGIDGVVDEAGQRLGAENYVLHRAMREQRRVGPQIQNYRRPTGELVQFEVTAAPISGRDSESAWSVVAFQDVTAKLRTEEQAREAAALRESEERFRLIAEQAPVMLWMCDAHGSGLYLNRLMREFHGAETEDAVSVWAACFAPEDAPRVREHFEAALRNHAKFSFETTVFRKDDGAVHVLNVLGCPRFNQDDEFLGLIGVNTDITESRRAERNLQEINELLAQRVSAALAEKAQAEAALMHAQRLESLGRLTGGVAHDFNNLLTVVIGALDIILRDKDNAARRTRLGETALTAARRGERLTAQLLAFARRQPLQPEICDLNDLIRECEPLLRRAAGENIAVMLQLSQQKAMALIDRTQFEASLLNLVVNAVDASPAGGVIDIETHIVPTAEVNATNTSTERLIRVNVRDRGHGMSADVMNQIFEPFFTTKSAGKGTGLGLSQVYGFVKQSGGEVHVESTPGAGTCMSIFVPLQATDSEQVHARSTRLGSSTAALNILVAEDDPSVAGITQTMLGELNHNVICVPNAEQALQVLRADTLLDVLLTDVIMPGGMNGVELAREAVRIRPGIHVLLCSGYAGESLDAAIASGEWPLLRKPYCRDELAEALAELASESTNQLALRE